MPNGVPVCPVPGSSASDCETISHQAKPICHDTLDVVVYGMTGRKLARSLSLNGKANRGTYMITYIHTLQDNASSAGAAEAIRQTRLNGPWKFAQYTWVSADVQG